MVGAPIAAVGAGLTAAAAVADLGKLAWDHREQISHAAGAAWDWAGKTAGSAIEGAREGLGALGHHMVSGPARAWHGVFG